MGMAYVHIPSFVLLSIGHVCKVTGNYNQLAEVFVEVIKRSYGSDNKMESTNQGKVNFVKEGSRNNRKLMIVQIAVHSCFGTTSRLSSLDHVNRDSRFHKLASQ